MAAAKAEFAKFNKVQPAIVIPVLPKKPPVGKTITVGTCPLPVCKSATDPAAEATKKLGWKLTPIQSALTPAAYQSTLNQIVANPTELVALTPVVPNSFVSKQLAALQAKKIPITELAPAGDNPNPQGPVDGAVAGPPQFSQSGRLMGDSVVADANGAAKTVFIWDPSLAAIWNPIKTAFTSVVTGAGGSVDVLDVSQMNIGKSIPTQVVSYVQAHPDVKYLAFALSDISAGVPQALSSAGLAGNVKIISRAPQASNLANIKSGAEWATVGEETSSIGYRGIDQLARLVEGVPLGDLRNPAGWAQIFTKNDITQTTEVPPAPGFPEVFLKAWHVQ